MVKRTLLHQFDLSQDELQHDPEDAFRREDIGADLEDWLPPEKQRFQVNKVIDGRVVNIVGDGVLVDVGYKSEGVIPLQEWYDDNDEQVHPPRIGSEIKVLLD